MSDFQEIWYGRDLQKVLSKLEFCDNRLSDSLTKIKGYHAVDTYCPVVDEVQFRSTPCNAVEKFGL